MSSDKPSGKPLALAQVSRLRFRHLQFLDILGKTRNLRLTAEQMHITQPAATKVLMDIEEMLESRLFDRLPRGMRPNELGLFTLRYAHAALDGHRKFVDEFSTLKQGGHGHLSIGAISGSAAHLLIAAVAELQRLRPLLVVKVLEQSSDQLITWLAERKIDIMIGRFTDESQRAQFQYEKLSDEGLQITAGVHHPLRGNHAPGWVELSHWPWILYPTSTALRKVSDDIFSSTGLSLTSGIVETPSFLFALELLQSTNMLSLQPAALVDKYVRRGLLARIASELPDRMPDFGMITLQGEQPSTSVQAFMHVIRTLAGQAAGSV
ncbi:LysR family transcriptional regulator [Rhizobacter sp. Root16D2]|uniref:LysR family transcriptional regulator n=1 Tax=unclassified Rhizobacter TaxID=2640088 RepID=UPI0006F7BFBF|nr:LysR family transcriptional regulator [Rhizobacter sp. Root16D2]KQU81181.1 LysR family transcriptional regulator [Rhizobacter sp. Root29]KQW04709.1 LysR family transcriptional regulator [Rhizobacter sp. Root1238]KRB06527.1 LysR family transcriptional regulator [Rhizobacter sp. Root16D2]